MIEAQVDITRKNIATNAQQRLITLIDTWRFFLYFIADVQFRYDQLTFWSKRDLQVIAHMV